MLTWMPDFCPSGNCRIELDKAGGKVDWTRPKSFVTLCPHHRGLKDSGLTDQQVFDAILQSSRVKEAARWAVKVELGLGKEHPGVIDVTTERSYLKVSAGFLPDFLVPLTGLFDRLIPNVFGGGGVMLGPIPQGTPVNLLANIDLQDKGEVLRLFLRIKRDLKKLPRGASDEEAREVFRNLVQPLLAVSKCPDFVVNRGHYFGTDFLPEAEGEPGLSDEDKQALIALLETF